MSIKPNFLYQLLGFSQRETVFFGIAAGVTVLVSCPHLARLVASVLSLVSPFYLTVVIWLWRMNGSGRCRRCAAQGGFAQELSCTWPGLFLVLRSPAALAQKPAQHTEPHSWRYHHCLAKMGVKPCTLFMNKPNLNPRIWRLLLD